MGGADLGRGGKGVFHEVGPHLVRIEPPDVLHLRLNGDVEAEHFQAFTDRMKLEIPPPTRVYVLRDARKGGTPTPKARAYISKQGDTSRLAALITYGATFHARTVLTMLNKAMRFFNSRATEMVFVDTEEQANEWIRKHRTRSI